MFIQYEVLIWVSRSGRNFSCSALWDYALQRQTQLKVVCNYIFLALARVVAILCYPFLVPGWMHALLSALI